MDEARRVASDGRRNWVKTSVDHVDEVIEGSEVASIGDQRVMRGMLDRGCVGRCGSGIAAADGSSLLTAGWHARLALEVVIHWS